MKVNKKFIQNISFMSFLLAIFVISVSFFLTAPLVASASTPDYIEFFDYDKYSSYSYDESGENLTASISLPSDWFYTGVFTSSFEKVVNSTSLSINPSGVLGSTNYKLKFNPLFNYFDFPVLNSSLSAGRFFDLRYVPKDSFLVFSYDVEYNNTFTHTLSDPVFYLVYVDYNGNIVSVDSTGFSVIEEQVSPVHNCYTITAFLNNSSIPTTARGFYFYFDTNCQTYSVSNGLFTVSFNELYLQFRYSDAEYNAASEKIIRNSVSNIDKTLNEVKAQLDDVINGTPQQNQQAQSAIGDLNNSTDKLGQLGDSMASVDKPTIDSNKISADNLVPDTSLTVLSSPFLELWENKQLLAMLTIVVTLVLVSWVFFGKKA